MQKLCQWPSPTQRAYLFGMQANSDLIRRFYGAFQRRDAATMAACYHREIQFSDPVFTDLRGPEVGRMWAMLCARGKDLRVDFSDVVAEGDTGGARWEADYTFSATRRPVHNQITAQFQFRDGLIVRHVDSFSFWRWSRQALGPVGSLLGWTPHLQAKVQRTAAASLAAWHAG